MAKLNRDSRYSQYICANKRYLCAMKDIIEVLHERVEKSTRARRPAYYFQMVYVLAGKGSFRSNATQLAYEPKNLLLTTPRDLYFFDVNEPSEFLIIRFDKKYIKDYWSGSIKQIECLLYHATELSGCVMRSETDAVLVRGISEQLLFALVHPDLYNKDLLSHFVNALIVIAARNIYKVKPAQLKEYSDDRIVAIIDYIQEHIFVPEKLNTPIIARKFDMSLNYFGKYFKHQCGETFQHFVSQYKLRLIETRLRFSDARINEIAREFGFTDESHLNKFFKKQKGVSLSGFRRDLRG
jgi:AraC-like DNA-binding protein